MAIDTLQLANVSDADTAVASFHVIDLLTKEPTQAAQVMAITILFRVLCKEAKIEPSRLLTYADSILYKTENIHLRAVAAYLREEIINK